MRELLIEKLKGFIYESGGYGIPRCFDCDDDDTISDPTELDNMSDEQLLEVFEATVGFGG